MKNKQRLILAVAVATVACGIVWIMLSPREPVYKGKQLSAWLAAYEDYPYNDTYGMFVQEPQRQANEAIRAVGTNGIPLFLRMLQAHDSSLKVRLIELAQKQHVIKIKFVPADVLNHEAMLAFMVLGPDASNAVPDLVKIFNRNISEESLFGAANALAEIGTNAHQAIPAMLDGLENTNGTVRGFAADVLRAIHAEPKIVVPALIKHLKDSEPHVREEAMWAVAAFGEEAKFAVPALIAALDDTNHNFNTAAADVLSKIDPEAAAKAGVK